MDTSASRPWGRRSAWRLAPLPFLLWPVAWMTPLFQAWPGPWDRARGGLAWVAFVGLLVPCGHVVATRLLQSQWAARRPRLAGWLIRRPWAGQTRWLRFHVIAAFLGFAALAGHCRGRAEGWLPVALVVLFWGVMLSGVLGYGGRLVLYRILRVTLAAEFGRADRDRKELPRLQRRARRLVDEYWKVTEYDIGNWHTFCQDLQDPRGTKAPLWETVEKLVGYPARKVGRLTVRRVMEARPVPGRMNPVIGTLNEALAKDRFCTRAAFPPAAANEPPNPQSLAAGLIFGREDGWKNLHKALKSYCQDGTAPAQTAAAQRCADVLTAVQRSQAPDRGTPHGGHLSAAEVAGRKEFVEGIAGRLSTAAPTTPGEALPALPQRFEGDLAQLEAYRDEEIQRRNRLYLESWSAEVAESRPPELAVKAFYEGEVAPHLQPSTPSWGWLFTPAALEPIPANRVEALRMCVGPGQARIVDGLMAWVERRRQLDVEAWLDRLANCWVPVHGWLAWVLLALTLDHVIGACLRGGWWPR